MDIQPGHPLDLIFSRRSIRVFAPGDVTAAEVETILRAAMAAPSAVAKDPWRFVVVRDKPTLARIADALPNGKMLPTASVGIFVCGEPEFAHDKQISYMLQDCAAAVENILLAAHGLGLGAVWLGIHPREDRVAATKKALQLPPPVVPVAGIAIGRPGEEKPPRTRFNPALVHYEKW